MAVIIVSFKDSAGKKVRDDIVVEGVCTQHLVNELAYDAVVSLISNREVIEGRPELYLGHEEIGIAEGSDGTIAVARWAENKFKFRHRNV